MAKQQETEDLTSLLRAWSAGEPDAAGRLVPLVYDELRRQAARQLRGERPDHTLRPTALVHEAYLRLVGQERASWQSRRQFFAVAAQSMRRVLVDHARQRAAAKRAGGMQRVTLEDEPVAGIPPDADILAVDEALRELAALDPRRERIVVLRFFAGLTLDEAAEALGVSEATVTREWRLARAWLHRRLASHGSPPTPKAED
jgi:RNA polymerase sigma factor (TIGR02999 family)